jgi:hypothetical protein
MGLVRNQPVGYPAAGFLFPNPFLSYNESVAQGVAELMRLILMNAGQFYLCGYSQRAEVVVRTLRLMLPGQPLAHRAGDLLKVITFGSPCRAPGPTLLGNNPPGSGISRIYTPEQFRSRTYDFVLGSDMYATAVTTSIVVGDFLIRNPHVHYNDWPDFNGVTGVDRAVQIVATGSAGGP